MQLTAGCRVQTGVCLSVCLSVCLPVSLVPGFHLKNLKLANSPVNMVKCSSTSTEEPLLKDHPIGHTYVVSQDKWSLVTGSIRVKYRLS